MDKNFGSVQDKDIITDRRQLNGICLEQLGRMATNGWQFTINDGRIVIAIRNKVRL